MYRIVKWYWVLPLVLVAASSSVRKSSRAKALNMATGTAPFRIAVKRGGEVVMFSNAWVQIPQLTRPCAYTHSKASLIHCTHQMYM